MRFIPLEICSSQAPEHCQTQDLVVFPEPLQWWVMEQRIKLVYLNFSAPALRAGPSSHSV